MFTHFGQRLKRDLKQLVDRRLEASAQTSGSVVKVSIFQHPRNSHSNETPLSSRPEWKLKSFLINDKDMQSGSVVHYLLLL